VTGLLHYADDVLRRRPWTTRSAQTAAALKQLIALIFVFGMAYGAVMGCYGGATGDRLWQVFYSAVKVPLLLVATSLIALPNFFVLNTLFGLRRDSRNPSAL
jgi:ABC-type dipeptide/oligopeptide/nickel transport system permease subunit